MKPADSTVPSAGDLARLFDADGVLLYAIEGQDLSNAVKHAEAHRIVLSLRRVGDSIVLGCADDVKGFDPAGRRTARATDADGGQHFGLSSIAERCAMLEASLRIDSLPRRGPPCWWSCRSSGWTRARGISARARTIASVSVFHCLKCW